jgi:cystathionine beta-lyase
MCPVFADLPVDPLAVLRHRRSAKWRTYPADVLPLTVAEMDFALAPAVADALHAAIGRSDTGYAVATPGLGRALAGFAGRRWDWDLDPDGVTAVTDVGVGLVELLRVLAGDGGDVVISPPVYPPFFHWAPEAGARVVEVPLTNEAGGWRLDLAGLEQAFARRPAAYVLCNPHNPVGRVHRPDELGTLVALAAEHGVTIVSDEIHAPLVLRGAAFTPLLSVPGAPEVAVSLLSASKAWNLAGLKCAAIVSASPTMAAVVDRLPPDARGRTGHLGVMATVAALEDTSSWLDQLLETLHRRRGQLGALLAECLPAVRWDPPEGTYLAWLDCRALGGAGEPGQVFLDNGGVALEPGLRFGPASSGWVRLNFATGAEILDEAVGRMAAAVGASGT